MGDLDNPATRPLTRLACQRPGFLAAPLHMRDVAVLENALQRRSANVASICIQVLRAALGARPAFDLHGTKYRRQLRHIMSIRAGHDERQRDATPIDQQMALAPIFSPGPSGSDPRPLAPKGPSSWPHQCSASARRCRPCRHIRPGRPATVTRRNRPLPIPESACGWHWLQLVTLLT